MNRYAWILVVVAACGPSASGHSGGGVDAAGAQPDSDNSGGGNGGGGGGGSGSYLVYAHSDKVLYSIDLANKSLVTVGSFNTPSNAAITDLAVAPDGTLYAISETDLYTASATDGHVTSVGSLSACGTRTVALTTTPDGKLWAGDYTGKLCQIDISIMPPMVKPPITMSNGLALSGDFVAVDNGTVFGTAYKLSDPANMASNMNNLLVTIDLTTGTTTQVGSSGFPKLFGAAYQEGMVFGFTHDNSGRVVTIDRTTGQGTLFGTFMDPSTNMGISFAGAAVNSLVVIQ